MTTEAQLTRALIDAWRKLGLPKTFVGSIPNQFAHGQAGLTKGIFDLLVLAPGLPIGLLELKTEAGKLSEAQTEFRMKLISAGAPHAIAYGLDEALRVLVDWKVIRREAVA
jgi:hypothetical protein